MSERESVLPSIEDSTNVSLAGLLSFLAGRWGACDCEFGLFSGIFLLYFPSACLDDPVPNFPISPGSKGFGLFEFWDFLAFGTDSFGGDFGEGVISVVFLEVLEFNLGVFLAGDCFLISGGFCFR